MITKNIKVKLDDGVDLPIYESDKAVGFDLKVNKILAAYKGDNPVSTVKLDKMKQGFTERGYIKLRGFERILFGTGIYVELPDNMELQVRPRSGTALKKGLTVTNSPGTIDSDYRGEVGVIVHNTSPHLTEVNMNDRLAQAVPKKVTRPKLVQTDKLSNTERGEGGFGSTGQ